MKLQALLNMAVRSLTLPLTEGVILVSHVTGVPKDAVYRGDDREVSAEDEERFCELVKKRIEGVPISYLRKSKEFYGKDFYVDERVLIPRPETEHVIEHALRHITEHKLVAPHIVDVGTGSGIIALTMARLVPHSKVSAIDVSPDALAVARKNAELHELADRVTFVEGDLLQPLVEQSDFAPDIIVTNLPYIAQNDVEHVEAEVHAHEPHIALYSGKTGIEHYERLFAQIEKLSQPPQAVIGEFGFDQAPLIEALLKKSPLKVLSYTIYPDLAGIPRVFLISFARHA